MNFHVHFCSGVFRCKVIDARTKECSEQMVWAWDTSRCSVQCAERDQEWTRWYNSGTADDSHAAVLAPVQSVLLLEYHHWGTQRDWWKCTSWNPSINLWVYWPEPKISWQVMKLTFTMHSYTQWYLVADDCSSVCRSSVLSVGDKKPSGLLKLIHGMSTAQYLRYCNYSGTCYKGHLT